MKRTLAAVFWLVLAVILSACHERQRQQPEEQLSPAVKAAVEAALGPHVSDADLIEFLRAAKLSSRTEHDGEVVSMLDEVVSLARSAAEDDYQAKKYHDDAGVARAHAQFGQEQCDAVYAEYAHAQISPPTNDERVRDCKEGEKLRNINRNAAMHYSGLAQNYEDQSKRKKERVTELVQKLRAELK